MRGRQCAWLKDRDRGRVAAAWALTMTPPCPPLTRGVRPLATRGTSDTLVKVKHSHPMPKKPQKKLLPEIKVTLARCAWGQCAVSLKYPENLGLRTKLGGEPDWIQEPETPFCAECDTPLTFVAQIDSVEHESDQEPDCEARSGWQAGLHVW